MYVMFICMCLLLLILWALTQPVMMSIWAFNGFNTFFLYTIIVNDLWYNFTMDFRGTIRCLKWVFSNLDANLFTSVIVAILLLLMNGDY
jgi:hypothetical protein